MSTALATTEKTNQVTKTDIDNWLFGSGTKLTEPQKSLFYQISMAHNLNPAKREIYAIPYGNNFNVIVGYEVYLKRAERTGLLEWWEAGVKKEGNEYIGFCTIKRKDRSKDTTVEAWFNEYNQGNTMWKTKPRTMIRKVAIAQAFRMVFPDELGGMPYTADEIETNGTIVDILPESQTRVSKMIASLNSAGKLGNAEKFIGKPSSQWNDDDVDKIEVAKKKNKPEPPQAPLVAPELQTNGKAQAAHENPTTGPQASGKIVQAITPAQLSELNDLMVKLDIPVEIIREDYKISAMTELDAETADEIITKLRG